MQFKTTCALAIKGDRVERGAIVEMSKEEAERFGEDLIAYQEAGATVDEVPVDVPLEEMTHAQLRAKAKELGVSASGSVADLRERIALNDGALEEEEEEEEKKEV